MKKIIIAWLLLLTPVCCLAVNYYAQGFNQFTAPSNCGTSGYVLTTDGNCITSWVQTSATNVLGTTLTGYSSTTGVISSADTVLSSIEKLNGNTTAITYAAGQFPAVQNGTDASIGNVGVFFSSAATDGGAPSGSYEDLTSILLPAGDWDITEIGHIDGTGGSVVSGWLVGVSTTTGNDGSGLVESYSKISYGAVGAAVANATIPRVRFNFLTPTTIYAKSFAVWAGGAGPSVRCGITARSAR